MFDPHDVRLEGFTPATYDLLASVVDEHFAHPMSGFHRPSLIPHVSAAQLFFLLRAMPEDRFPGGKWATVQHLEDLIDAATGVEGGSNDG